MPRPSTRLAAAVAAVLTRHVQRVEVGGRSMLPTLAPGDRLLVVRRRRIRPGQVVALADPRQPWRVLVKRATAVDGSSLTVLGDNPAESTDSRTWGPIPRRSVLGVAVYRYAPSDRVGRLPSTIER